MLDEARERLATVIQRAFSAAVAEMWNISPDVIAA
jgi:hypothetical protein